VQAAGGPVGQNASYETVALDLEALVMTLPPTTHVLLDHVTGDELKAGAVPLKARGGTRKVEWARNQWSLVLDREKHHEQRHVVGWTHTKINRTLYLPAFGVEIVHRADELGFQVLEEQEVGPLKEKMANWRQVLLALEEAGKPLSRREIAVRWLGASDPASLKKVGAALGQYRSAFADVDGRIQPSEGFAGRVGATGTAAANGTAHTVLATETNDEEWDEPEEQLPF
jgi:hypothetical protein